MTVTRCQKIFLLKKNILEVTENLLLENNQEIIVSELAKKLDIAKGTIYKHFKTKNQLYLELLIVNEQRLLDIAKMDKMDVKKSISAYMRYHLENAKRTILLHNIESRITNQERGLKNKFQQLYEIREKRILEVKDITLNFLKSSGSSISVRDYQSYVWGITFGACLLISSTYYQETIGMRANLIDFYIEQALHL